MEKLFGIPMDSLAVALLIAVGLILTALVALGWRNRIIMRLGLRNIPRRRAQTALIVFGLMLSTLIVSAAFGTGDTMTHSFRALALDQFGEMDEMIINSGQPIFFEGVGMDFGADRDQGSRGPEFLELGVFASLTDRIHSLQATGDDSARLIEALTPVIVKSGQLVINRTARQSELAFQAVGYDAATADAFDTLFTVDGKRVTIAELKPGEVYLREALADELAAEPGHELEFYLEKTPIPVTVRGVIKPGALLGQILMPLEQAQAALGERRKINAILVSNIGGPYAGREHSADVAELLTQQLRGKGLRVDKTKESYLFGAELMGSMFTTMFIGFGSFSIAAGLLLIFLIFVMLAAERLKEMGMARAVGTRRRHLIQMFMFEGTAYDLAAAAVGALLGTAVGLASIEFLARGIEGTAHIGAFQLRRHVEPRSVIVAYCLGVLLTFFTVTVSSWRVSRLNIVSAIRDLPPPPAPDAGLRALFAQPWRHLIDAVRQLLRLRVDRTLKRMLWNGPISSMALLWALIGRGPLTALIGLLSLQIGLAEHSAFLYSFGISLILIGVGLMVRWTLRVRRVRPETRDRIAFSFAGIGLLVYWSLTSDLRSALGLPDYDAGPEMFVLSGVMMVAGAVWTIIYNSDLLLGLVSRLLSPLTALLPVVRTAIAYPMHAKFRTGLTIAMFALVIFMLVFMSVFVHILNETLETASDVGDLPDMRDYDIRADTSEAKPVPNLRTAISAAPELNAADYVRFKRHEHSYLIKLADGVDIKEAARALESAFLEYGMETRAVDEQIQEALSMMNVMLGLFQGFMGLGLVVGSASIGIVSTRAVVERRQQIGVLRAIGYRPWMIQWSFLLEASFVALVGILIGVGLGLILAYNFFQGELASTPGTPFSFAVPWASLLVLIAIAYGMSMVTTYLPSWQAARIYPAEALRYE